MSNKKFSRKSVHDRSPEYGLIVWYRKTGQCEFQWLPAASLSDVTACDEISHIFPLHTLAYWKRSNTGGGKGSGTRLCVHQLALRMRVFVHMYLPLCASTCATHACVCAHVSAFVCASTCAMHACVCAHVSAFVCACIHVCVCAHVSAFVCACTPCVFVHMYLPLCVHACVCGHPCVCVCVCAHACMHVCVHACVCGRPSVLVWMFACGHVFYSRCLRFGMY